MSSLSACLLCSTERPKSAEESNEQVRRWAEEGKAWAQRTLGQRYYDGVGVDQSYQQAKELFELAACQGYASAQCKLGNMHYEGRGVGAHAYAAVKYYEAAARQGHADAQYCLGGIIANGRGVEQSFETAREWLMKSAEQGHEHAIKALQTLDEQEGRTTPSFIPKPFECATCYRPHNPPEHTLRPCKQCHRVYYCGRECQVEHWKREQEGHKEYCKK